MQPLEGITILDFTQYTSGPVATTLMSDLGADVIKIENPPYGDSDYYNAPSVNKKSSFSAGHDHGKKSILINLKDEEHKKLFYKMVRTADAVVDNFKAGTMQKLGVDYEVLKNYNPKIVCASISGFGQNGPWANRAAFDVVIQAVGGLMSVSGEADGNPIKSGYSLADVASGSALLPVLLAAIYHAKTTGEGCSIDLSMMDTALSVLSSQVTEYGITGKNPERTGNVIKEFAPSGTYLSSDGQLLFLCIHNDQEFERLCQIFQSPQLAQRKEYLSNAARIAHRGSLDQHLNLLFSAVPAEALLADACKHQLTLVPVQTIPQADSIEQLRCRNMTSVHTVWADGTRIRTVGCPIKLSDFPDKQEYSGAVMGADTVQVLSQYLSDAAFHNLYDETLHVSAEKSAERSSRMK